MISERAREQLKELEDKTLHHFRAFEKETGCHVSMERDVHGLLLRVKLNITIED